MTKSLRRCRASRGLFVHKVSYRARLELSTIIGHKRQEAP